MIFCWCFVSFFYYYFFQCGSHDVLVLLEREAEDTIAMTAETGCSPSRHINVERVTSSAYMATLPGTSVHRCLHNTHVRIMILYTCVYYDMIHNGTVLQDNLPVLRTRLNFHDGELFGNW